MQPAQQPQTRAGMKRRRSSSLEVGAAGVPEGVPSAAAATSGASIAHGPRPSPLPGTYASSLDAVPATHPSIPGDLLVLPGEQAYLDAVGASGLKITARLACTLHPANWCSEQPRFRSCLSEVAYAGSGGAMRRALAEVLAAKIVEARSTAAEEPFAVAPVPIERRKTAKKQLDYQGVLAGTFADSIAATEAAGAGGGGGGATAGAAAVAAAALAPPPAAGAEAPPGPVAAPAPRRRGGLSMSLEPYVAAGASHRGASPTPPAPSSDPSFDTGVTEQVLTASMGMDLAAAPIGGDSWLASDLIDFIACRLARAYPSVHFLPTNFLAFELPNATRSAEAAAAYVATDLLGRPVRLLPDALPIADMDPTFYGPTWVRPTAAPAPAAPPPPPPPPRPAGPPPPPTDAAVYAMAYRNVHAMYEKPEAKGALLAEVGRRLVAHRQTPAYAAEVQTVLARHPEWMTPEEQRAGIVKEVDNPFSAKLVNEIYKHLAAQMVNNHRASIVKQLQAVQAAQAAAAAAAAAPQPGPSPPRSLAFSSGAAPKSLPPSYKPLRFESPNLPLVFFWNQGNMHWNLVRVHTGLRKVIEIYEPMGKAERRAASTGSYAGAAGSTGAGDRSSGIGGAGGVPGSSGGSSSGSSAGLSLRSVPKALIAWLDQVCPLEGAVRPALAEGVGGSSSSSGAGALHAEAAPGSSSSSSSASSSSSSSLSWRSRTLSAITSPHQGNGFDCGVACLVYAEKCGQGLEREDIEAFTSQDDITLYRNLLHDFLAALREKVGSGGEDGGEGEGQP